MKFRHLLLCAIVSSSTAAYAEEHDLSIKSAGGKPATQQTQQSNQAFAKTLNFKDIRAFENNDVGLVAEFDQKIHQKFTKSVPKVRSFWFHFRVGAPSFFGEKRKNVTKMSPKCHLILRFLGNVT